MPQCLGSYNGFVRDLYPHQKEALATFRDRPRALNLSEYGTGKTAPTIVRLRDLVPPHRALVVVPTGIVDQWLDRLAEWGRPDWTVARLTGSRQQRAHALGEAHDVAVLNWEGLRVLGSALRRRYGVVVFDEVHRTRDPHTLQSRAAADLSRDAEYVYGLTGSPVLESPTDAYGVLRAIDPEAFHADFSTWRRKYFQRVRPASSGRDRRLARWEPQPGTVCMLRDLFRSSGIRHTRDELPFDWPEQVVAPPLRVPLHPEVAREYRRMERDFEVLLRSGVVAVSDARARMRKLCQIACGWIYKDSRATFIGPSTKAGALAELVEEIRGDGPMVIWAVHLPDMVVAEDVLRRQGVSFATINGATQDDRRVDCLRALHDGRLGALISHPRCIGEGVDLDVPSFVRFTWGWSHLEYAQPMGRFVRLGGRVPRVTYTDIVAADTVEEEILAALRVKQDYLEEILARRTLRGPPTGLALRRSRSAGS